MTRKEIKYLMSTLALILIMGIFGCERSISQESNNWEYNSSTGDHKYQEDKLPKRILKEAKKHVKGLQFITGGSLIMGKSDNTLQYSEKDSCLLVKKISKRVTVPSFYMCDHEVTNAEYREFVHWVRDSIARELLAESGFEEYRNKETDELLWDKKIEWDSQEEEYRDALISLYLQSEDERYYRTKKFDYRKFVYDINISSDERQAVSVYPDTTIWSTIGSKYSYIEPLSKMYFWSPSYNDFPIVGISWEQANAYCNWLTNRLKSTLIKSNNTDDIFPTITMPTEAQWEYAAISNIEQFIENQNIYPWNQSQLKDISGNYLANFGSITDQNGKIVKSYAENRTVAKDSESEYLFTTPVKHFPPNNFTLYDMGGNVAEWVTDFASISNFDSYETFIKDSLIVNANDDLQTAFNKIAKRNSYFNEYGPDTTNSNYTEKLLIQAKKEIHDAIVLEANKNGRIVKGGSWINDPKYLRCSSREVFSQNRCSAFIGFRVAMIIPEQKE